MLKKSVIALAVCCTLGVTGGAAANTFLFDPDGAGAGAAISVTTMDWAPGSVLAVGGNPDAGLSVGDLVTDYYQANLTAMLNPGVVFTNGAGGNFFTVVAGFTEQVTATGLGFATFGNTAAPTTSFFRICAGSSLANDLTGGGFACTDANAILTGTLQTVSSAQFLNLAAPPSLLDQNNVDNWGGQLTVSSIGAANITVLVNSVNNAYFPDLFPLTTIVTALSNTSLITPYNQADPSYCFSSDGVNSNTNNAATTFASGCSAGTFQALGTLGPVNGFPGVLAEFPVGPNFIFQADANTTVIHPTTVPEPATLALVGLGLAAASMISRRRRSPERDPMTSS
jgi:hypothetical protein